ncbi:RNA-binding motif, single-stranded-interacting protein 2 [Collichthys lucidus]|nr:RNA-binding motif, single-stranded-interacting protein 2 [Collichthys lucidus]
MLLSVPPRAGINPYNGYNSRNSKKSTSRIRPSKRHNTALSQEARSLSFPRYIDQAYVSSGHQMAPPSPNTNSSSNNSGGGGEQLSKTNLYIRGLHPGTTDQDLVKLCQP